MPGLAHKSEFQEKKKRKTEKRQLAKASDPDNDVTFFRELRKLLCQTEEANHCQQMTLLAKSKLASMKGP